MLTIACLLCQNPNDPVSYVAALLALAPQALCIIYVTLIWASREMEVLLMFAGQMACEALNFFLKRVIRQERPPRTCLDSPQSTFCLSAFYPLEE